MWARSLFQVLLTAAAVVLAARAASADDEVHEGKVVSVTDDTITVMDRRDEDLDTFVVTAETKITKGGKAARLSDIRPGDVAKVTASALATGGKLVAKEITVIAPM